MRTQQNDLPFQKKTKKTPYYTSEMCIFVHIMCKNTHAHAMYFYLNEDINRLVCFTLIFTTNPLSLTITLALTQTQF